MGEVTYEGTPYYLLPAHTYGFFVDRSDVDIILVSRQTQSEANTPATALPQEAELSETGRMIAEQVLGEIFPIQELASSDPVEALQRLMGISNAITSVSMQTVPLKSKRKRLQ